MLAEEMVERFHSKELAQQAVDHFVTKFSKKAIPDELPELLLTDELLALPWPLLLKSSGLVKSSSEANRLLKQGAVKVNQVKIDADHRGLQTGDVLSVGKKVMVRCC